MLIRFSFSNFLSFRDDSEISMVAGPSRQHKGHLLTSGTHSENLLKACILYGANASGKSNFVRALSFMQDLIVDGSDEVVTFGRQFKLDPECKTKPSTFEVELSLEGKIYAYGFDIDLGKKLVLSEWLSEVGKTKDKFLFSRSKGSELKLGLNSLVTKERQRIEFIGLDTLDTQLFLTELASRNIREIGALKPILNVFDWFVEGLKFVFPDSILIELGYLLTERYRKQLGKYLHSFGTGIEELVTRKVSLEKVAEHFNKSFIDERYDSLLKRERETGGRMGIGLRAGTKIFSLATSDDGPQAFELVARHKAHPNEDLDALFEMVEESDGTQRLIDLLPSLFPESLRGTTLVIDEINRSLHPALTIILLELFFANSEGMDSQLIATTHEVQLLNLDLLRRDEIWFAEKDQEGSSKLFSLEEFRPRHDKELQKGYMFGRFGGIPEIVKGLNLENQIH